MAGAGESGLRYLSDHVDLLVPVIFVYLVSFGVAHLLFGVNRLRCRRIWVKNRDLLMYLRGADLSEVNRGRGIHHVMNALFLSATALLLASGWWLVIPALPSGWGLPQTIGGFPLGWVVSGVVVAVWATFLILSVRRRFANLVTAAEDPLPVVEESATELPRLTLDGTIPIPQLSPRSPLQESPRGLDVIPGDRSAGRRLATLTAIGRNEGCRYVPSGNQAAATMWLAAKLEVAGGGTWWERPAEPPKPGFAMPTPAELTEILCRVMYQSGAVEGIVGKRSNAVVRDFCLCHELCLMVTEDELARLLRGLAEADWPRRSGEQTAAAIHEAFEGLDTLPTIEEYLTAWMDHEPGASARFRAGEFDPLRNGVFRNLQMDFTTLGRALVQAVIFADRRIDAGESDLAQRLGLGGDFESEVEPTEVTP